MECLGEAIREFESLGPDLPKRAAALAAESKVMDFPALTKTSTQDPSLFERSEEDGVGDGEAWSEQIPHDKEHNLEKVMSIVHKTLLRLDGELFSHKLEQLSVADDRMQRVHELFNFKVGGHSLAT